MHNHTACNVQDNLVWTCLIYTLWQREHTFPSTFPCFCCILKTLIILFLFLLKHTWTFRHLRMHRLTTRCWRTPHRCMLATHSPFRTLAVNPSKYPSSRDKFQFGFFLKIVLFVLARLFWQRTGTEENEATIHVYRMQKSRELYLFLYYI